MRFKVGATRAERAIKKNTERECYLTQWHAFFCLIPRRVGDEIVWLEVVLRKGRFEQGYGYSSDRWEWEYRIPMTSLISEELKLNNRVQYVRQYEQQRDKQHMGGHVRPPSVPYVVGANSPELFMKQSGNQNEQPGSCPHE